MDISLHIVKQCKLSKFTLFYCMDAIKLILTYILFYNVIYYKFIISKVISKVELS